MPSLRACEAMYGECAFRGSRYRDLRITDAQCIPCHACWQCAARGASTCGVFSLRCSRMAAWISIIVFAYTCSTVAAGVVYTKTPSKKSNVTSAADDQNASVLHSTFNLSLQTPPAWPKTPATTYYPCLLYTSPSPRDGLLSRMPSSA